MAGILAGMLSIPESDVTFTAKANGEGSTAEFKIFAEMSVLREIDEEFQHEFVAKCHKNGSAQLSGMMSNISGVTECEDIGGTWNTRSARGKRKGNVELIKTGECEGKAEGHSWTWKVNGNKATLDNGITGTIGKDGHIKWSNGATWTRPEKSKPEPNKAMGTFSFSGPWKVSEIKSVGDEMAGILAGMLSIPESDVTFTAKANGEGSTAEFKIFAEMSVLREIDEEFQHEFVAKCHKNGSAQLSGMMSNISGVTECEDISGSWDYAKKGHKGGSVVLLKTGECEGKADGQKWTWKSTGNKITLSNGVTGTIDEDGDIQWSNGWTYTRSEEPRPEVNPQPACTKIGCRMHCPHGYEKDDRGCNTCKCKAEECEDIGGTWDSKQGSVVFTKSGKCSGGAVGHDWTWTIIGNKITINNGVTGTIGSDGHIRWSNGWTYTRSECEDISGTWDYSKGSIVLTKTGKCEGGAVNFPWTWKYTGNKLILSTGVTGTISHDWKSIKWSNGISYSRAECEDIGGTWDFENGPMKFTKTGKCAGSVEGQGWTWTIAGYRITCSNGVTGTIGSDKMSIKWSDGRTCSRAKNGGKRKKPKKEESAKEPFTLVRKNQECHDNRREKRLGHFKTVEACAEACRGAENCHTFIYGIRGKAGWCYNEGIANEAACTSWQKDQYHFYQLNGVKTKAEPKKKRRKRAPKAKQGFTLVRSNQECNDNTHERKLGTFGSVEACAEACSKARNCKTFIFGKGRKKGRCYNEGVANEAACSRWQRDVYDFYEMNGAEDMSDESLEFNLDLAEPVYAKYLDLSIKILAVIGVLTMAFNVCKAINKCLVKRNEFTPLKDIEH